VSVCMNATNADLSAAVRLFAVADHSLPQPPVGRWPSAHSGVVVFNHRLKRRQSAVVHVRTVNAHDFDRWRFEHAGFVLINTIAAYLQHQRERGS